MFVGAVALFIFVCLLRSAITFWIFAVCVTNLHNIVSERVIRAKILFFDSNPIGRIVTRFSKDILVLDFIVPAFFVYVINGVFRTVVVSITVGIINPWLFIAIAVAVVIMVLVLRHASTTM
jgi:ATP-binding cassette, subfamily C (CFTR/MRP), member 4